MHIFSLYIKRRRNSFRNEIHLPPLLFPEVRPKQIKRKNWVKIEYQNRLDWPTADQLAQNNNPRVRQNRILRINWTGANFSSPKLIRNHVPKIFPKNKLDKARAVQSS